MESTALSVCNLFQPEQLQTCKTFSVRGHHFKVKQEDKTASTKTTLNCNKLSGIEILLNNTDFRYTQKYKLKNYVQSIENSRKKFLLLFFTPIHGCERSV
jgi:hypothetical protein